LGVQAQYGLAKAEDELKEQIKSEVIPFPGDKGALR
jgi:hypothetical protein